MIKICLGIYGLVKKYGDGYFKNKELNRNN